MKRFIRIIKWILYRHNYRPSRQYSDPNTDFTMRWFNSGTYSSKRSRSEIQCYGTYNPWGGRTGSALEKYRATGKD